jgi:FHS family Na+ dependent glucose MFS transporter 1
LNTPTRSQKLTATFAYYATYITLGATMALSGPALPWLAQNTSSRIDQISIIFVATSLGYMTGSLLSGRLFDRFPGHRIQALALLVIASSAALVPVLHSLPFLVAVLFLLGNFQGALDVGCNTLLNWTHAEKVGPFMNGLHFFFGLGSFLAPLVFARMVQAGNEIRWAFWIFSLLALPVAAWLWRLPSPPIHAKPAETAGGRSINLLFLLIVFFFVFNVGLELGYGNWLYTFSTRIHLLDGCLASAFRHACAHRPFSWPTWPEACSHLRSCCSGRIHVSRSGLARSLWDSRSPRSSPPGWHSPPGRCT